MQLFAVTTGMLKSGDDLAGAIIKNADIKDNDIIVISSKAAATVEGAAYDLQKITPSAEAVELAKLCGKTAQLREAMLMEIKRMNGRIVRKNKFAVLTELQPDGMTGSILVASAGLDESNAGEENAIGWPRDPVRSVQHIRGELMKRTGKRIAAIISDSCCRPRRLGVTAFALTVAGIDPLESLVGSADLFGHHLRVTQEARADQLAVAANFLMGNAAQATPAVVIRDHALTLNDFAGWVPGIDKDQDMFDVSF